jgi:hypothetical protein
VLASQRPPAVLAPEVHDARRPTLPIDVRNLVRQIRCENPLWSAPRINGELLKLRNYIAQPTIAKHIS